MEKQNEPVTNTENTDGYDLSVQIPVGMTLEQVDNAEETPRERLEAISNVNPKSPLTYESYLNDTVRSSFSKTLEQIRSEMPSGTEFPHFSINGAMTFSQEEMDSLQQNIANSHLAEFINTPSENFRDRSKYYLVYGGQIYSRGEAYYYSANGNYTASALVGIIHREFSYLMGQSNDIISEIKQKQADQTLTTAEWKAALTYFDHLKSFSIQLFHAHSYLSTHDKIKEDPKGRDARERNETLRDTTYNIIDSYYQLLQGKQLSGVDLNPSKIRRSLNLLAISVSENHDIKRILRDICDADHPLYNLLFSLSLSEKIKKISQEKGYNHLQMMGVHYGGIEIPFTLRSILEHNQDPNHPLTINQISAHYSRYSNKKQVKEHRMFDKEPIDSPFTILIDDSIKTGQSLRYIEKILHERYPGMSVYHAALALWNFRSEEDLDDADILPPEDLDKMLIVPPQRILPYSSKVDQLNLYTNNNGSKASSLSKQRVFRMLNSYYSRGSVMNKRDPLSNIRAMMKS